MTIRTRLITASFVAIPIALAGQGQGIDPAQLLKPLADQWPTHNGDYSGKRYSRLTQINQSNVKHLTLAWAARVTAGANAGGGGRGGRGGGRAGDDDHGGGDERQGPPPPRLAPHGRQDSIFGADILSLVRSSLE